MPKPPRVSREKDQPEAAIAQVALPAGFDRSLVVATREFGVAASLRAAIGLITTAADLTRGVNPEQLDCHVLAPIALAAIWHLYSISPVPEARVAAVRRFMAARHFDEAAAGAAEADSENPWWGRHDARDLRAPEPWKIDDLRCAARDFLCVEADEFARDPGSPVHVRLAARIAIGALALVTPDGTSRCLLPGAVAYTPRREVPGSIEVRAWLGEILTGTHRGDLAGVARAGHRLLAIVATLAADPLDARTPTSKPALATTRADAPVRLAPPAIGLSPPLPGPEPAPRLPSHAEPPPVPPPAPPTRRGGRPRNPDARRERLAAFLARASKCYSTKEIPGAMAAAGVVLGLRNLSAALSWASKRYPEEIGRGPDPDGVIVYGPRKLLPAHPPETS